MGVFPADRIPVKWTRPAAIVANTDDHKHPGRHWVAMYLDTKGHCIYFDSYGEPPLVSNHFMRIKKNSTSHSWNVKQLQSYGSTVCGHYCIMFLYYMMYGYSLEKFCKLFSDNHTHNDRIVSRFYKRISGIKQKNKKKRNRKNTMLKGYGRGKLCIQKCKAKYLY